ncbi:MAG: DUF2935 domain-containing protein [Clostridiales bacterium]|nr:DUF2935 domain-containing protein [Clostridiales bacterium]
MLSKEDFIGISIEINLYFQRIMKEHSFFMETALPPAAKTFIEDAKKFKLSFEQLLSETVNLAKGVISREAMESNAFVTPFTLQAEEVSTRLTGASLDTEITKSEYRLLEDSKRIHRDLDQALDDLNRRTYYSLKELIAYKKNLLNMQLDCKVYASLYPLIIIHITREAEYYLEILEALMNRRLPRRSLCDELNFWNNIMGEHAQLIDGLLDPTEKSLKETAANFVGRFDKLVDECLKASERQIIQRSFEATKEIRDFKRTGTEGLLKCSIRSIVIPLLADHVLREANFYLRMIIEK